MKRCKNSWMHLLSCSAWKTWFGAKETTVWWKENLRTKKGKKAKIRELRIVDFHVIIFACLRKDSRSFFKKFYSCFERIAISEFPTAIRIEFKLVLISGKCCIEFENFEVWRGGSLFQHCFKEWTMMSNIDEARKSLRGTLSSST